jgi:hypothetical protein
MEVWKECDVMEPKLPASATKGALVAPLSILLLIAMQTGRNPLLLFLLIFFFGAHFSYLSVGLLSPHIQPDTRTTHHPSLKTIQ